MNTTRLFSFGSERGSALVELAVSLPLLVLIFVGTVDFGRVFYTAIALTDAARAGAQFGAFTAGQSGNIAGMQTTAVNAVNTAGITAVASRTCQCATSSGTFTPTVLANDCTSAELIACPLMHRVITVTVTTTKTFTTVISGFPGIPSSVVLTRSATLRVQP